MDLGRAGEGPPRAAPPPKDTNTTVSPARPANTAGAGRAASSTLPASVPLPAAASPFLAAHARALALAVLGRLDPSALRLLPHPLSAPLAARLSSEAPRQGPLPSTHRLRRLESLAALAVEGGLGDAETEALVADLEGRVFPPGGGGSPDGGEAGRGGSGGGGGGHSRGREEAPETLAEDAEAFARGLSTLGGFAEGRGRGARPGSEGLAEASAGILIPFAFSALAGGGFGKNIEFRGFLRIQYPLGARHAPRVEAHLEAGSSPWSFSLDGSSWRLERAGGKPASSVAELEALAARLGTLGFSRSPAVADAPEGDEGGGLWA